MLRASQVSPWSHRLVTQKISSAEYTELISPAFDWILHCLGREATDNEVLRILKDYVVRFGSEGEAMEGGGRGDGLVLMHILDNLPPVSLAGAAADIVRLILQVIVQRT